MMQILVNGLSVRNLSGEHVLVGHLSQLASWACDKHTFLLLHDRAQESWVQGLGPNVRPVCIPQNLTHWAHRFAWEVLVLPRRLKQWGVDVVFTPSGTILPRCDLPQVSLAQNPWCMVPEVQRTRGERRKAAVQRYAYRHARRHARLMCYNSRYMQRLYRENAGGDPEPTGEVVYQAIDETTHRQASASTVSNRKQPGLIVSVSAMAPWKGSDVLVEALAILHRQGCRARLRLVGPWPDRQYEAMVRHKISVLGLEESVTITGKVSKEELHRHYAEASVYCLMSRCESFGIPAIEAQAFGTPVVGSSVCAMPEICGEGGLFGPPRDPIRTAGLLGHLLDDKEAWRTRSELARINAARYRWETCSLPLLKMFSLSS